MSASNRKRNGVHYTPPELAHFLASQIVAQLDTCRWRAPQHGQRLQILDPACGKGRLLVSLIETLKTKSIPVDKLAIFGFDTDREAVATTADSLKELGIVSPQIFQADFLTQNLPSDNEPVIDIVITNPPYVRTQVLGGQQAQAIATKFGLTGRIDLYQAFVLELERWLKPSGVLGLLTSNRFLTVNAGAKLRQRLVEDFEIKEIFDLGDTKLFSAAVLPVVVTAVKRQLNGTQTIPQPGAAANFHRVYLVEAAPDHYRTGSSSYSHRNRSVDAKNNRNKAAATLGQLADPKKTGLIQTSHGNILIERGQLRDVAAGEVWSLSNPATQQWINAIESNTAATFGQLAEIKVGIKTTADSVFVRDDWESLPKNYRPEPELLRPLLTHHVANRWRVDDRQRERGDDDGKKVLYPYVIGCQKRKPIRLNDFPRAARYLDLHREQLAGRQYVRDAGREWFEIWVPHQPGDWEHQKIVWPDISVQPRFWLDQENAIVNGDCYWTKLRDGVDPDWLYLMLAVANSTISTKFYDTQFHNKLYSGRRRFMTQYVKTFPLPQLDSKVGRQIVSLVRKQVVSPSVKRDQRIETLVKESFGFDVN